MIRFDASEFRVRPDEAFADLRERFSQWVEQVRGALDALPRVDVRHLPFTGGQTNLEVATPFAPAAVILGGVRLRNSGAAVGTGVTIDWAASDGGYQLRSVAGLTSGTEYTLTLVALGND